MQVAEYNVAVAEYATQADMRSVCIIRISSSTDIERHAGLSAIAESYHVRTGPYRILSYRIV